MENSESERAWIDLAIQFRKVIESRLNGDVTKLSAAELFDLSRAMREGLWLETTAFSFDKQVGRDSNSWS